MKGGMVFLHMPHFVWGNKWFRNRMENCFWVMGKIKRNHTSTKKNGNRWFWISFDLPQPFFLGRKSFRISVVSEGLGGTLTYLLNVWGWACLLLYSSFTIIFTIVSSILKWLLFLMLKYFSNIGYQPLRLAFLLGWCWVSGSATAFVSDFCCRREELSTVADWGGAGCWGRMINQNYARASVAGWDSDSCHKPPWINYH